MGRPTAATPAAARGWIGRDGGPPALPAGGVAPSPAVVACAAGGDGGVVPPPSPRLAGLTRLRLVFIGWVVLYHLELALRAVHGWPLAEPVLLKGYLGVDGFFLLSGFALWLGYHARPPRGAAGHAGFVVRRMARILPLHWASLLGLAGLVGLAVVAGAAVNDPERFSARDFALQLLLINAWETTDRLAWAYPSWALSAVWAGYLAFPVLLGATRRLPAVALWALAPAALLGLALLGARDPGVDLNLTVHLGLARFFPEFWLGLLLGRLCTEGRIAFGAALAVAAAALPAGLALRVDAVVVAGLAALIAAVFLREAATRPGAAEAPRDPWYRLGEASFGVYMCWVFVEAGLVLLLRATDPGPPARLALMAAGLAATLGAGWLAWRLLEVPANRWILARLAARQRGVPAAGLNAAPRR